MGNYIRVVQMAKSLRYGIVENGALRNSQDLSANSTDGGMLKQSSLRCSPFPTMPRSPKPSGQHVYNFSKKSFENICRAGFAFAATMLTLISCGKELETDKGGDTSQPERDPNKVYVGVGHCGIGTELQGLFKKCIEDAGGEMVWFEYYTKYDGQAEQLINTVDALIVPGSSSGDMDGRTACDKRLISEAGSQGKPVLGICFGCQKINQSRQGTVPKVTDQQCWKDYAPESERINHYKGSQYYVHSIKINTDSRLYKIYGTDSLFVNSSHQYCVVAPGEGIRITAYAPDGIVEAIETIETNPMNASANYIGVQYHPERLYGAFKDSIHLKLFKYLVDEAKKVKEKK